MNTEGLSLIGKSRLPRVKNVVEVLEELQRPTHLHFSAEQWKNAIAGFKEEKGLKEHPGALRAFPMPGGNGDFLVTKPCGPPPDDLPFPFAVLQPMRAIVSKGVGPQPDPVDPEIIIVFDECPDDAGPTHIPKKCKSHCLVVKFEMKRQGHPVWPTFSCLQDHNAQCGGCELVWERQEDGAFLLCCKCIDWN